MDVSESDIVESVENGGIHVIQTADAHLLGIAPDGAGHKLVRNKDVLRRFARFAGITRNV